MTNRNPPPSNRQLLILLGIFVGFIVLVIWLLGLLINGLIGLIPPSVEQKLGTMVVSVYEEQAKPSPIQDTLNQLLDRAENNLPAKQHQERNYRVLYLPEPTVNALAIPGDVIIVYQGLLEAMESENELMMVLGHELGHFAHRDHLRRLGRGLLLSVTISYFIGDVGALQSVISKTVQAIGSAQYSQSQEKEADEFGLSLLNDTYGHAAGATDFFARLSQEKGADLAFLSSHPASRRRVEILESLIKKTQL